MVDSKHNFNVCSQTSSLTLVLLLIISFQSISADESKLNASQNKILKDTFLYLESIEPKKIKIDKTIYQRLSKFDSYFKFPFSGKKLSKWIQSRIKDYSLGATGDFIAIYQDGEVLLGKDFFKLNRLERVLVLLHEARHADGKKFSHIECPEYFEFVNPRNWKIHPAGKKGCDSIPDGAYGLSASFLFELGAYGYLSQSEAGYRYNSELIRIIKD
ncbi:hypothetical protein P3G55_13760 [Leptospira sp. 96542]|nr:hypothetical protein [Leptospira sp. 96542]